MTDRRTTLPLAGFRILAFTQLGAGPYGMTLLGDLGAEIIKVEDPTTGGDEARNVPPYAEGGDSLYFQALNRNARSLTLNLRTPEGRSLLHKLATCCDAVYANPRGDLPAKLGLDYASLKQANPRIVCCSLTGYGRDGPRHDEPAYDYLLQGMAGFMSLTGDPEATPAKSGISIIDFAGGAMSALGLVVGLLRARESGVGGDVDISLLDTAVSMLNYLASWNLTQRRRTSTSGRLGPPIPGPVTSLRDRRRLHRGDVHEGKVLAAPRRPTRPWPAGRRSALRQHRSPADQPRSADSDPQAPHPHRNHRPLAGPTARSGAVRPGELDRRGATRRAGVAPQDDRRVRPRKVSGAIRQVGSPIKLDGVEPVYGPASRLGADTADILRNLLGLEDEEIGDLRQIGAI